MQNSTQLKAKDYLQRKVEEVIISNYPANLLQCFLGKHCAPYFANNLYWKALTFCDNTGGLHDFYNAWYQRFTFIDEHRDSVLVTNVLQAYHSRNL